jgi:outer membrane immunogenic protein
MRISALTWACGVVLACSSLASAADMPRPAYKAPSAVYNPEPVYNWTGFYAGVHGGYGWSNFSGSDPVAGDSSGTAKGWLGGVQLGYNYQVGKFVIGAEADYSWADVKNVTDNPFGTGGSATLKNDYFVTAALRLGYAVDRTLLYVKGGGAWTRDKFDVTDGIGGFANGTFNRSGWMIGAGAEYAFWNNWSAKVEYNFLSFGSIDETLTTGGGLTATTPSVKLNSHLLKVGLNYKFF